jgi:hypothetical protein
MRLRAHARTLEEGDSLKFGHLTDIPVVYMSPSAPTPARTGGGAAFGPAGGGARPGIPVT